MPHAHSHNHDHNHGPDNYNRAFVIGVSLNRGFVLTETALTVHLVMPDGHPGDAFLTQTCQQLHQHFGIEHTTIQVERGDRDHPCVLQPDHRI